MEILTTIWNALTVENEGLINIIYIPMTIIELTISMLLFTTVLNIQTSNKNKLLYIIFLSGFAILTHLFLPIKYHTFINILASIILIIILFKTTIFKAILADIIAYFFFVIFGVILSQIFIHIYKISDQVLLITPIYKILFSLCIYSMIFSLFIICKYLNINISILDNMDKKTKRFLLIDSIIGIFTIAVQSYILLIHASLIPWALSISSIISLLIYFIFTIYSLYRTNKLEITTQNLEEQKLYNKTLTILYDNVRGFKHDFNNIVQTIGGYITADNMDGLKNYYSELVKDCTCVNNLTILNPEVLNNPAIYSILTYKYHKAEDLGIKVNLDVFLDLSTLNINTYKFTKILGILLDNAIEASSNSTEKVINITIRKDLKVNRNLFIIENSYSNKNVNIDEIFEKGYTSKNKDLNNHGLGLWEVRKILRKSKNINLYTAKTKEFFKQQLEIYNEKL